ncbi:MATE family efflux transporter [Peijinzhouia sedimentorum]
MKNSLSYREHFRRNITLAYPVVLSQLGQVMVAVVDSAMVGQTGSIPLAAASLANSITFIMIAFAIGISYAITPLIAAADGQGRAREISEILRHGLVLNIFAGLMIFILIASGSGLLHYMGQDPEVVELAIPYMGIIAFSIVPLMVFQTFRQFTEGLSQTRQAMVITIASNLLNVFLNYLLIFGKWGFPALGLNGAGWATLISRVVMATAMFLFVAYAPRFASYIKKLQFKRFYRERFNRLLGLGIPSGMQFLFEVSAFSLAAVMVGWLGADALAAHQIGISLASITFMMASGVSAASTIRIGNQLGRKDIPTLRVAGFSNFLLIVAFMAVSGVLFIVFRDFLPTLFITDADVIATASSLLIIAAFFQIFDGVQVVSLGILRGLQDVKVPTLATFVAYWIIGLPVGYLLAFEFGYGIKGVWYGLSIGLGITAVTLFYRFDQLTRKLRKAMQ